VFILAELPTTWPGAFTVVGGLFAGALTAWAIAWGMSR